MTRMQLSFEGRLVLVKPLNIEETEDFMGLPASTENDRRAGPGVSAHHSVNTPR